VPVAVCEVAFTTHAMTVDDIINYVHEGGDVNAQDWRGWTPLILAIEYHSEDACRLLIEKGADVNQLSFYHWSPLMHAIEHNNIQLVTLILGKGANVNEYNNEGMTPLLMAVKRKQRDIAKLLLTAGADTYAMDANGQTVLDLAAKNNDIKMLEVLIQNGVNPDIVNKEGYTCFYQNTLDMNPSVLAPLVKLGANPNIPGVVDLIDPLYFPKKLNSTYLVRQLQELGVIEEPWRIAPPPYVPEQFITNDTWGNPEVKFTDEFEQFLKGYVEQKDDWQFTDESGNTFLHWMAENGKPNWVEWAIQQGMDVNVASKFRRTPLHRAVKVFKCEPSIRVLMEYGADVEAVDFLGNTPLHYALFNNRTKAMEMLLNKNASINEVNAYGMTPLHYVLQNGGATPAAQLTQAMLLSGADPTLQDFKGETILHLFCKEMGDYPEALQDIIEKGGNVNQANRMGEYPLHLVSNNANLTKVLIQNGADLEVRDRLGQTPLVWGIYKKNKSVLKALIEAGADVNARAYNGCTPLHYAVWVDSIESLELLIEHGGDLTAKSYDKESVLDFAKKHNKVSILTYIEEKLKNVNKASGGGEEKVILFDKEEAVRKKQEQEQKEKKAKDDWYRDNLLYSCEEGSLAMAVLRSDPNAVMEAINNGADVDEFFVLGGSYHYTALYLATRFQEKEIIQLLVENGADVNLGEKKPAVRSPLHLAAVEGYLSVTQQLVEYGADMSTPDDDDSPFVAAVRNARANVVAFYENQGFDIQMKDKSGKTLLHRALYEPDTIQFLLEKGLDPNVRRRGGKTPLYDYMMTAQTDTAAVPKLLIDYGADVNAKDDAGNTPLCEALAHDKLETVKLLVQAGADVKTGTSGWSQNGPPIHLTKGNIEIIAMLLNHGADIHALNKKGQNVIHSLVSNYSGGTYDVAALEYYLEQGVDINGKDSDGETPIFCCIEFERLDLLRALIENGADIEATDKHGRTPLWHAIEKRNTFIVKLLLENGVNTNVTDKYGETLNDRYPSSAYGDILEIIEAGG
jgi:ankyrin repeat protein